MTSHSYTFISLPFWPQSYSPVDIFFQYNQHGTDFWTNRNLGHPFPLPENSSASLYLSKNTELVSFVSHFLPVLGASSLQAEPAGLGAELSFIYLHGIQSALHQKQWLSRAGWWVKDQLWCTSSALRVHSDLVAGLLQRPLSQTFPASGEG